MFPFLNVSIQNLQIIHFYVLCVDRSRECTSLYVFTNWIGLAQEYLK